MDDTSRLRLVVVGLVLAAIAGGYFVYTQATRVTNNEPVVSNNQTSRSLTQLQPIVTATPSATPSTLGLATEGQPTTKGGQTLPQSGVSSLPNTGAPIFLIVTLAASAATIGWGLKQYPK